VSTKKAYGFKHYILIVYSVKICKKQSQFVKNKILYYLDKILITIA